MIISGGVWISDEDDEADDYHEDERCASVYGPERVRCTERADLPHEWHHGGGVDPDGEAYNAAWLSHWERS